MAHSNKDNIAVIQSGMPKSGAHALRSVELVKFEWESAVDSVPQLICVLRKNGEILRSNRTVEHWGLGTVSGVRGKSVHETLHPGCHDKECYLKRLLGLSSKVIATGEGVEYRAFDGLLKRQLHIRLNPLHTGVDHGDHSYLVIIASDIGNISFTGMDDSFARWNLSDVVGHEDSSGPGHEIPDVDQPLTSDEIGSDLKYIEKVKREWESAVDSLPQIICLLDTQGEVVRANRAIEQWRLGSVKTVKGRKLHEMLHPGCDDQGCYLHGLSALVHKVSETGRVAECQEKDRFLSRHLHFQINSFNSKTTPNSGLVVLLIRDVTDIKRAELKIEHLNNKLEKKIESRNSNLQKINQRLQREIEVRKVVEEELIRSRKEYSLLVEMMNEGMVIQDATRKITYANRRMLKMLGYPRNRVIGHYFSDFIDNDYLDGWEGERLESIKGLESAYVIKIKARNGKSLWVKVSPQPLLDADKTVKGSYAVITDINDHIETEKKLLRTENQLRTLSKQVLSAQELERKRIASELHDGIGQTLSAIKFFVENQMGSVADVSSSVKEQLSKVVPKLQDAIEEVRRISMDLRPSLLDDIGVIATLNWFCREAHQAYGNTEFVFEKIDILEDDIPIALKTEIFRIVQEAVNNASKYSKAKQVRIILKSQDNMLNLEIRDDGKGFDYNKIASVQGYSESKGMGLASMRERVENTGGWFSVNSVIGFGTAIGCAWVRDKNHILITDRRTNKGDRRAKPR